MLPFFASSLDVDVAAETFTNKVERLALSLLIGPASPDLVASIAEDVARIPEETRKRNDIKASADLALSAALAGPTAVSSQLLIRTLAPEMKKQAPATWRHSAHRPARCNFGARPDHYRPGGKPIYVEEYRKRIEEKILLAVEADPALKAVREGKAPTREQLVNLERLLHSELGATDIQFSQKAARQVYGLKWDNRIGFLGLLRHVLSLDAIPDYGAVVERAFEEHMTSHNYTGEKLRFLRAVEQIFVANKKLSKADLYDADPLMSFGLNAVERLFSPVQIDDVVRLTEELAA